IWVTSHYSPRKLQIDSRDLKKPGTTEAQTSGPSTLQNATSTQPATTVHLDWVLEGTHAGKKPCCQEGTYGAELASWTDTLRRPEDGIIVKKFFSAFKETKMRHNLV